MIRYFSHTFIGDILDGDRLGLDSPLAKDRRYPNERLTSAFEDARETAQLMEELGYDMMWLAEHHFQPEGYECIPNVLMLALWLAQHTGRLKFGCAFNIAPMWHPLRLAEDFATVDVLTGGARDLRRWAGLSHAGGRDLRHADAGRRGQPRPF